MNIDTDIEIASMLANVPYITRKNIELILGDKRRTTDYRIYSLVRKKILQPLKKGLYMSLPYYDKTRQRQGLSEYIASILVSPSYISMEYMLAEYGLIPESVYGVTSITTKKTRRIDTALGVFSYRNIKESMYKNFIPKLFDGKKYYVATPAKAVFDFLYETTFPSRSAMSSYLLSDSRINWDVLTRGDRKELTDLINSSKSAKMKSALDILVSYKCI